MVHWEHGCQTTDPKIGRHDIFGQRPVWILVIEAQKFSVWPSGCPILIRFLIVSSLSFWTQGPGPKNGKVQKVV